MEEAGVTGSLREYASVGSWQYCEVAFVSWQAKLGGRITVISNGIELGPPENKTVAVLLIGLLSRGADWSSREELARLLYPESDPSSRRAALRQTLFRLRRWLGESALEEVQDRIRLAHGAWSYDLVMADGEVAPTPMIAPGLAHPWVEALRLKWVPPSTTVEEDYAANFAVAVQTVASKDPDTARSILVGGANLASCLSVDTVGLLLGLTQPKDRRDPFAFEHIEMRCVLYERLGHLREAKAEQIRAYRLASQQRRHDNVIRAGAMLLFLETEDGQMGEAAAWVDYLQNSLNADTKSLFFCNARAAYLWNMHRLDEAVAQMGQAIPRVLSADRATKLHFWTNYAALSAEAGCMELGRDTLMEARSLAVPGLDVLQLTTLDFAQATGLMNAGRAEEAISLFQATRAATASRSAVLAEWYSIEGMAEALALAGRRPEGIRLWRSVEAERLSRCTRLTPRLLARRGRIMRSA